MLIDSTLILTKKGWLPISKLKKDMILASPKGHFVKIKDIHVIRNYNNKLFIINQDLLSKNKPFKSLYLTGDNKVFSQKSNKWFLPRFVSPRQYKAPKPINLYNIILNNPKDTLFANGMVISSMKK